MLLLSLVLIGITSMSLDEKKPRQKRSAIMRSFIYLGFVTS
jgi:hypothetical protein